MVFSLILNSFIILLMRNSDAFNEIDSILYQVLAVEDMIFFITGLSIQYIIKKDTTNCVHDTCHRWSSLRLIVSSAILYQIFGTLLTINLCRYLLIVKPLHYLQWITKRRVVAIQAIICMVSVTYNFGLLYILTLPRYFSPRVMVLFVLPIIAGFVVLLATNIHIMLISLKQSKRINAIHNQVARIEPSGEIRQGKRPLDSFKGLRTTLLITFTYCISWIPYILSILESGGYLEQPSQIRLLSGFTTLLNSAWNYALLYRQFRLEAIKLCGRIKERFFENC